MLIEDFCLQVFSLLAPGSRGFSLTTMSRFMKVMKLLGTGTPFWRIVFPVIVCLIGFVRFVENPVNQVFVGVIGVHFTTALFNNLDPTD